MGRMPALPHGGGRHGAAGLRHARGPPAGARAGTARGASPRRSAPCPARRRRAGCRRSCAGSGGRRRRRCRPGGRGPTCAFMFAPSMYTCPPCSCTIRQISRIDPSNTPWVRRVGHHERREACRGAPPPWPEGRRRRRCRRASLLTATTFIPAITALAGLVPWADMRDQADGPVVVAAGAVIGADHQQAGVLALRARVGLQRHAPRSR